MPSPYILLGFALALALVGLGAYRHGVSTTANKYEVAIQKGAAESERVTREAVEKARKEERTQLENIRAQNENTAASLRARIATTTRERDLALRSLADEPDDDCLDRAIPGGVRGLLRPSNPHGAGGGNEGSPSAGAGGNDGGLSGGGGG